MPGSAPRGLSSRTVFVQDTEMLKELAPSVLAILEKGRKSYVDIGSPAMMWENIKAQHFLLFAVLVTDGQIEEVKGIAIACLATTESRMKVLKVLYMGGTHFHQWWQRIEDLETIARKIGLNRIDIELRPGLWRYVKRFGYKARVLVRKELV
jgi:hypothetical protein